MPITPPASDPKRMRCECGLNIAISYKSKHLKSMKHRNLMTLMEAALKKSKEKQALEQRLRSVGVLLEQVKVS